MLSNQQKRWRHSRLLAGTACAALVGHASSLAVNVAPNDWLTLADRTRWSLAPDAVLFTTGCVVLCAPVFGATATRAHVGRRGEVLSPLIVIATTVVLFTVVSALLTVGWRFGQGDALAYTLRSHATLAAVAGALAAWGALCSTWFRDPLDAAGVSLLTTLIAACGLLVGGAATVDLPRSLVAAGLTASPLVAVASAAQIDLLHSDLLYQISPLAHVQIDYPTWTLATACYLAVAGVCILLFAARTRRVAPRFS